MDVRRIVPLDETHSAAFAGVLRAAFSDLAKAHGLTRERCPGYVGFITAAHIAQDIRRGLAPFGIFDGDTLIATAALLFSPEADAELSRLSVLSAYRHEGLGRDLIDFAVRTARAQGKSVLTLTMMEENRVLFDWYTAQGFVHTRTVRYPGLPFAVACMERSF